MITLTIKKDDCLQSSVFESIEDLKNKYYSNDLQNELPAENDEVISVASYGEPIGNFNFSGLNTGLKFLDLIYLFNIKPAEFIPVEKISELVDLYYSNHEDLVDLEARYNNYELDENVSPNESFEQGYENALLQVFGRLGITLEKPISSKQTVYDVRVDVWVSDSESLSTVKTGCLKVEDAKENGISLLKNICKKNRLSDGFYPVEIEISSRISGSAASHYVDSDEFEICLTNGEIKIEY